MPVAAGGAVADAIAAAAGREAAARILAPAGDTTAVVGGILAAAEESFAAAEDTLAADAPERAQRRRAVCRGEDSCSARLTWARTAGTSKCSRAARPLFRCCFCFVDRSRRSIESRHMLLPGLTS